MTPAHMGAVVALVLILLAGGAARLVAQAAGHIRGRVVRADEPVGLADADVALRPSGASTLSDARGVFEFRGVAAGRVEVAVRRVGFTPTVVVLEVDSLAVTAVDIPLEAAATILSPVITAATRDERSVADVPAAVSVADSAALRRDRTVGLHEALRMIPGVEAASRYGTDDVNIGIRGSAARSQQAVRGVAVLLDGIPLTESDGAGRLDLIELAAARQIEVVRGPASALYAGSPGGVVNVVSRTGRDSPGVSAGMRGGAFGFRKYDGHAGGVLAGGRGSGFAAASYTSAGGYRAHSDGDILRGHARVDYVAGPGTRVAVEANGSRLDSRLPGPLNQAQLDADPDAAAPAAVAFGFGRADTRWRAGARLDQAVGIGIASAYLFYGGRTLDFPIPGTVVDLTLHRVQAGGRVRAGRVAGAPLDATIGLDYDNLFGSDRRWLNDGGAHGALQDDGYFSVPNLGAYAEVEWRATRTAGVAAGLRYDRVTYRFESYVATGIPRQERSFDQLSPRLSALWSPGAATSLYASAGRGFEVPVIGELSASPGAPLRSLRPKSLWNYEVGARRAIGRRALVAGSVFYAAVRGEFVPRTVNGVSVPQNASRSRNVGVELSVTARATRRLDLGASYTFLDLRLLEYTDSVLGAAGTFEEVDFAGKVLPAVPRHRVTGEARFRPGGAVDLGVQVEWQSVVYVETGNAVAGIWYVRAQPGTPVQGVPFRAVPARALVHLNAAWRVGPATLFGSVENLFGLRYAGNVRANEILGRFYEPGPPAAVSVGLRVTGWAAPGRTGVMPAGR